MEGTCVPCKVRFKGNPDGELCVLVMDQKESAPLVRSSGTSARLHLAPTLRVCSSSASSCPCWWWYSATGRSCWRCEPCRCGWAHEGRCSPPFAEGGSSGFFCTFCDLQVGGASGEQRETRVLQMVVCMVAGYLLCWMPYGAMAMLASFGPPGVVPPSAGLIPSLLAKTSTVLNPVIYVRLNHQVEAVVLFAIINVTTVHLFNSGTSQFCRCFLYMIGWSSEASPTPVNQTLSACQVVWLEVPSLPGLEQNPAAVTFKTQPGCLDSSCSMCNVDLKSHWVIKSVTELGCF